MKGAGDGRTSEQAAPARDSLEFPKMPRLFFLFLDGVGIGRPGDASNPLATVPMPVCDRVLGEGIFQPGEDTRPDPGVTARAIDATLGIGGLPQSGTGQTAILTGENAPALLGRHFGPYPHSTLRTTLGAENIFRQLSVRGRSCAYLNAFPARYFSHLERHPNLEGAFPAAWRMAGNNLNTAEELMAGKALSADCTSRGWGRLGYPLVPVVTPETASDVVMRVLDGTNFVFYEYSFTDHAGHGRRGAAPEVILPMLDRFIGSVAEKIIAGGHAMLITSDHGNLEDLSTKTHTRNPVPFICAGAGHAKLAGGVDDLTGIRRAVLAFFHNDERGA